MEGNVLSSYLWSKFWLTLKQVEADLGSSSKIILRFQSTATLISTNTPRILNSSRVDLLYELIDALPECTIFAHEQSASAASKKGPNNFLHVVRFETSIRSRLDQIDNKLKPNGPDHDQNHPETTGPSVSGPVLIKQADPAAQFPIRGFEPYVLQIEKLLMPQDGAIRFNPVGIVGRCGCGKTELAYSVFSSHGVEAKFFPRIWVGLSEWMSDKEEGTGLRERVLIHILKEIRRQDKDLEYGDHSVVNLLEKVRLRLLGKRYLIVLDDAWRMDEWFLDLGCTGQVQPAADSFTQCLPKGSGGAVIVTSRGGNVVRQMVGEKAHVIRPRLSDQVCWKIFCDAVERRGRIKTDHPTLPQMKESVIDNFRGLPLAANTLANVISDLLAQKTQV